MTREIDFLTPALKSSEIKERTQRAAKKALVHGAQTADESAVLDVLRKDGPHDTVTHIVDKTGLTASTVSKVLSDLIERKLVHRTNDGLYGQAPRISAA